MNRKSHDRRVRDAAMLEKQFEECGRASAQLLATMSGDEPDYYNMPIAIALLRVSSQLGTAIARLDSALPQTSKESQNRGSIPK